MMFAKVALAAVMLAMAGSAQTLELPVHGARFHVPVNHLKGVRFSKTMHQQYDFSCGSAALATLLTFHYAYPVTEEQVFTHMYLHGDQNKIRREGFSLLDMKRFLASQGFRADGFQLPLEKLVQAKLPALVLIAEKGYQHFVVVKGIEGGRVLIGDPSRGTRALPLAKFQSLWVGQLLFVIHGFGSRQVRFNDAGDWRAAPAAPLAQALPRDSVHNLSLPRNGPGDF